MHVRNCPEEYTVSVCSLFLLISNVIQCWIETISKKCPLYSSLDIISVSLSHVVFLFVGSSGTTARKTDTQTQTLFNLQNSDLESKSMTKSELISSDSSRQLQHRRGWAECGRRAYKWQAPFCHTYKPTILAFTRELPLQRGFLRI